MRKSLWHFCLLSQLLQNRAGEMAAQLQQSARVFLAQGDAVHTIQWYVFFLEVLKLIHFSVICNKIPRLEHQWTTL